MEAQTDEGGDNNTRRPSWPRGKNVVQLNKYSLIHFYFYLDIGLDY